MSRCRPGKISTHLERLINVMKNFIRARPGQAHPECMSRALQLLSSNEEKARQLL
jgi:hypothetical protein